MTGKWVANELDETEKHLLFIALLRKLELIEFRSPAVPSLKTMEQNFELLTQLVIWKTNALLPNLGTIKLPRLVIEYPTSHTLDKIRVFLKMLLDAKNGYQSKYLTNYHLRSTAEMRANEERLKRLASSAMKRNGKGQLNYEKALATFALQASGVAEDDHRYSFWIDLFQVKEPDIYQISPKHFHAMKNFLELELEGYTREADIRALKVLRHVRDLVEIVDKGPAAYYDIHDISLSHASEYMTELKKSVEDTSIGLTEPDKEKFRVNGKINLTGYLTALSTYRKAMEYRRLTAEKTNIMKKQYQSDSLEARMDSEDKEYIRETPIDILMETGVAGIDILENEE